MTTSVSLDPDQLNRLDLQPVEAVLTPWLDAGGLTASTSAPSQELRLRFTIEFPREPDDPRELSEIPEVRLWFVRLDAHYPWIPLVLDWESGELTRYVAMLVPHQFSPQEGIQFNPEALELFVMHKVFDCMRWMRQQGNLNPNRIKFFTQMLGYDLEDAFFELLGA